MSCNSRFYSKFSSYFHEICQAEDKWDTQVHIHTTEEFLLFVHPGSCTVINNGVSVTVDTPAFIWNRAGSFHFISDVTDPDKGFIFSFQPQIFGDVPKKLRQTDFLKDSSLFVLPLDDKQTDRLQALFNAGTSSPFSQRPLLLSCIFDQINHALASGLKPIRISSTHGYIFEIVALLQESMSERIPIKELADRFHVGQTKLKADFKKVTGVPLHTFQLQQILHSARAQMAATNKPLAQIAYDYGFADETHLIRAFRKQYGETPGVFRRRYKNKSRSSR